MAMAIYDAVERGGVDTSKPQRIASGFSENTGFATDEQPADVLELPEALRITTRDDRIRALEAMTGRRGAR